MNDEQKKELDLLYEFDGICKKNGFKYCLNPNTTGIAKIYGQFPGDFLDIGVLMPMDDCLRFVEYIETTKPEGRVLEHMRNSKNYPAFNVAFVDETTTHIRMGRGTDFKAPGIKITIDVIRRKNRSVFADILEVGWESNGYRLINKISISKLVALGVVRIMMIAGKHRLGKFIFSKLVKTYKNVDCKNETMVRHFKQEKVYFEKGTFQHISKIKFENGEFPVPENSMEYLNRGVSVNWEEIFAERVFTLPNQITLANISYRDFLLDLEQKGCPISATFRAQRKVMLSQVFALSSIKSKDNAWQIARRSGDRLRFYEEYQEKKEIIENLYHEKNYNELNKLLAEQEQTTIDYLKQNLGLCVSQEILDLQCELLENRGEWETVKKLRALVPEEHKIPLKV